MGNTMRRRTFLAGTAAVAGAHAFPAMAQVALQDTEATLTGGKGGRVIRVTTLKPDGPGSFLEAVKAKGPRIIVFEVGGVIDLGMRTVKINNGDVTIAGQTAPSLVTFIRGGIGVSANNVVIEHIAVRPGEAGQAKGSGWECDGISAYAAKLVRVANCSLTWATDEGLSASGPRFEGNTPQDWRTNTSSGIRFENNIVAEGLSNSTHSKGEHSKGTLIHDSVRDVRVSGSLYAHNMERNILFKGGAQGVMHGNVVYNPGKRFAHYNLHAKEWEGHSFERGQIGISGNTFLAGPSTDAKAAAFMLGGEGPLALDMKENLALNADGSPLSQFGTFGAKGGRLEDVHGDAARVNPADPSQFSARMARVLETCGARPWERDPIDARIVSDVRNGTGRIIDSEQEVGGYPVRPETRAPFIEADWDLATMMRKKA
jgi:hypothetical protein